MWFTFHSLTIYPFNDTADTILILGNKKIIENTYGKEPIV
jgi:hypothetical protein